MFLIFLEHFLLMLLTTFAIKVNLNRLFVVIAFLILLIINLLNLFLKIFFMPHFLIPKFNFTFTFIILATIIRSLRIVVTFNFELVNLAFNIIIALIIVV